MLTLGLKYGLTESARNITNSASTTVKTVLLNDLLTYSQSNTQFVRTSICSTKHFEVIVNSNKTKLQMNQIRMIKNPQLFKIHLQT